MQTELSDQKLEDSFAEFHSGITTGPLELFQWMQLDEQVTIIDLREAKDYAQGHIAGAINFSQQYEADAMLNTDGANILSMVVRINVDWRQVRRSN